MKKMEILAPVGGQEQLLAAVRCGADAVYLGAKGFNARQNAENFGQASLAQAVGYCHARGVRAYVTVNTLVADDEIPALVQTLREVADSGADAVIVQDMAVAELVRRHCPQLALHASTQMTIHNTAGLRALEALGFSRVVLARELSLAEIRSMAAESPLEMEVFVHGALCMCVSGACYLSSMLGGRSGNRGLCAQPCRLDFRFGSRSYALSLRDLSALQHVQALTAAGVCALKIEGRMKRSEYVAAAVTACRQALAGEPYDLRTLEDVFSRNGFTDGYLTGKRGLSMFGTRRQEDVQASQRAQKALGGLWWHEAPSVAVEMKLSLAQGEPARLEVSDGEGWRVAVAGETPQVAESAPTDIARAERSLGKTGGYPFRLSALAVDNVGALMLPAAAMNAMRRDALQKLLAAREAVHPLPFVEAETLPMAPYPAAHTPKLRARIAQLSQWDGVQEADEIVVPLALVSGAMLAQSRERILAEMPALIFPGEEDNIAGDLRRLAREGLAGVVCENLGAVRIAGECGLAVHGGHGLNLLNTTALQAYAGQGMCDATVSFEMSEARLRRLGGTLRRGALAYGRLPLMQMRCCPVQRDRGCEDCPGHAALRDRLGVMFPVVCHGRRYTTLYNSVPLNLSDEWLPGVDFLTLYFTDETAEGCRRILEDFRLRRPPDMKRTRGLYRRTLQ